MGRSLPVIQGRTIDADWKCQRSGDCCRQVPHVVMTDTERRILELEASMFNPVPILVWEPVEKPGFVKLQAAPCPFLTTAVDGLASCMVHSTRPYNCRRWGCFRPDPKSEPLEPDGSSWGFANISQRIKNSRAVRRAFDRMQRKAQRWALNNGWIWDPKDRS